MKYCIIQPPDLLKPYVRYFWTLEDHRKEASKTVFKTLVDDSSGLIFQHHEEKSAFSQAGDQSLKNLFFYGQSTRPTTTLTKSPFELTGVHFHPHAITSLFGVDAHLLTDQMEDCDLFRKGAIDERLMFAGNNRERLSILAGWLQSKALHSSKTDFTIIECLHKINAAKGDVHITTLIKMTGKSERHLERLFKTYVGIPPKLYIRIIRFREALRLMKEKRFNKLSDVAIHLNYSDQSHFTRDIRQFSGYTPKSLSENVSELILNLHIQAR